MRGNISALNNTLSLNRNNTLSLNRFEMDFDFIDNDLHQSRWWLGTWREPGENTLESFGIQNSRKINYLSG